ncbi:MAG: DUF5687 family protein [Chryseolinea sp.]
MAKKKLVNLTSTFLSHLYKGFTRSSSVGKDTAVQIMLGFIVVVLVGYSLALGFALEKIILNTLKQRDAVTFLNGLLLYYLLGGFITRYFLQNLPTIDAQPYLHLPISRSKIANFLICKSLVHITNISTFLLFTPFALSAVAEKHGMSQAWAWLLCLWLLSLTNHFLVILVKKSVSQRTWLLLTLIAVCSIVAYADYFGWIKLSLVSENLFSIASDRYTLLWIVIPSLALFYYAVYKTFINNLYPEELGIQKNRTLHPTYGKFLQRFGLLGAWVDVELKLIFRNKRSRELFLMHAVFLLLPLGFFSYAKNQEAYGSFLFFSVISSGFFTMNYGQYLFSWQGAHFDFILTQPTSIRQFVESKFWILASTTAVWFLLSMPYAFLGWHFLLINLAATFYNMGVNTFVVMNMSMWGAKKIDLKHPGSLNYEGIGAAQWLMGIPLIASPFIFYTPFSLLEYPMLGLASVSTAGLIGILLKKSGIAFTTERLLARRHRMASNFRKD